MNKNKSQNRSHEKSVTLRTQFSCGRYRNKLKDVPNTDGIANNKAVNLPRRSF